MNIRENLATNLIKYRKANGLTQLDLAEKLNYSDKAVSKWECGESLPDLVTLKTIADIYGTTIDVLISTPTTDKAKSFKNLPKKRLIISLCSVGFVWLLAMLTYFFLEIFLSNFVNNWICFVYSVPISLTILLVLTSVWGKSVFNTVIVSLLAWSLLLVIYLTINLFVLPTPSRLWILFLVGVPLQILIIFWFFYKKVK